MTALTNNRRGLVAGIPLAILALVYGYRMFGAAEHGFPEWMSNVMQVEFFAIHSGATIGIVVVWRIRHLLWRTLQYVMFALLMSVYLYASYLEGGGINGIGLFLSLTLMTYLGWLLKWKSGPGGIEMALRWFISFVLFMLLAAISGVPEGVDLWDGDSRLPLFGLLHFGALSALELSGLYSRIFDRRG